MTAFTAGALCTLCDCKRQAHLNVFGAVHKLCLRYKCQASATKRVTCKLSCFFFFSFKFKFLSAQQTSAVSVQSLTRCFAS